MTPELKSAFTYHRNGRTTAQRALELARMDVAANRKRHPVARGGMRGGQDFTIGSDSVFWCERPDDYLRRVGFVDELKTETTYRGRYVDHKGWFLDDDLQDEIARGVVFRLPGKDGKPRFMYGVADPFNDGPVILSHDIADNEADAARWSDQLAEWYAEKERDYSRASNAGNRYRELGEQVAETRSELLELCGERREIRAIVGHRFPAACHALNASIKRCYRDIVEARKERASLFADFGDCAAFNDC